MTSAAPFSGAAEVLAARQLRSAAAAMGRAFDPLGQFSCKAAKSLFGCDTSAWNDLPFELYSLPDGILFQILHLSEASTSAITGWERLPLRVVSRRGAIQVLRKNVVDIGVNIGGLGYHDPRFWDGGFVCFHEILSLSHIIYFLIFHCEHFPKVVTF